MNPRSYASIRDEARKSRSRGELMTKVINSFRRKELPAEVVVKTEKENKTPSTSTPTTSEASNIKT